MNTTKPSGRSYFALAVVLSVAAVASAADKTFKDSFEVNKTELSSVGTNQFFVLSPGYQLVLEGKQDGKPTVLTITVLNTTKLVDGVNTRVVEEREVTDGQLTQVSRNYFALSTRTKDVFYFGEDVADYENGRIKGHEGSWMSGAAEAQFGLMMQGSPALGSRYQQEAAPKVAMDRAEVVSLSETVETPAGRFRNCLRTEETSSLESGKAYKFYATGIGLVQDGGLKLTRHGYAKQTQDAKPRGPEAATGSPTPNPSTVLRLNGYVVQDPTARAVLYYVGEDPEANAYWVGAINDLRLSAEERKDLIEDLNEDGLFDPKHPNWDDLPLIYSRIQLIEELAPYAVDQANADAFAEAYKDLVNLANGQGPQ